MPGRACERDGRRVFSLKQSLLQMPFTRAQRIKATARRRGEVWVHMRTGRRWYSYCRVCVAEPPTQKPEKHPRIFFITAKANVRYN